MATDLKTLPYNADAELAVLGAIFRNPKVLPKIKTQLNPSDFYRAANSEIFRAVLSIEDVDIVTVSNYLQEKKLLKAGGLEYLSSIVDASLTSIGYQTFVDIVKTNSIRRHIILGCSGLIDKAYNATPGELTGELKTLVKEIQAKDVPDISDSQNLLDKIFKDIERRKQSQDHQVGIPTGLGGIDEHIGGLEPKSLTYLIGRPSMGKTALALSIADNIAQSGCGLVLFFSLEMGDVQLTRRRLAARSRVFLSRIRHGDIVDGQWGYLIQAANELAKADMLIVDKPKYKTIESLVDLSESLSIERKISSVFVDHIQLMRSNGKFNNRHLEISHISSSLKDLAKNLDIPVVGLSQLSREVEKRSNKRPVLSDLKESGDLEQDADLVIGIYRKNKESEEMELGGIKGRDIGTWESSVQFDRFTQRVF